MNNPFRRNKDVSAVPAEIQDYYQSERRDRTGIAWLLALGTLIVTIGLATLLFFGGRWAYRAIVNNDDTSEVAQTDEESENSDNSDSTEGSSDEAAAPSTGTSSTSTSTPNTPSTTPATPNTPATPARPSVSVAGDSTDLPNTGPGDIVAIVAATTAIGTAAHYAVTTRRTES